MATATGLPSEIKTHPAIADSNRAVSTARPESTVPPYQQVDCLREQESPASSAPCDSAPIQKQFAITLEFVPTPSLLYTLVLQPKPIVDQALVHTPSTFLSVLPRDERLIKENFALLPNPRAPSMMMLLQIFRFFQSSRSLLTIYAAIAQTKTVTATSRQTTQGQIHRKFLKHTYEHFTTNQAT